MIARSISDSVLDFETMRVDCKAQIHAHTILLTGCNTIALGKWVFQVNIFLFRHETCCGYSSEVPQRYFPYYSMNTCCGYPLKVPH